MGGMGGRVRAGANLPLNTWIQTVCDRAAKRAAAVTRPDAPQKRAPSRPTPDQPDMTTAPPRAFEGAPAVVRDASMGPWGAGLPPTENGAAERGERPHECHPSTPRRSTSTLLDRGVTPSSFGPLGGPQRGEDFGPLGLG